MKFLTKQKLEIWSGLFLPLNYILSIVLRRKKNGIITKDPNGSPFELLYSEDVFRVFKFHPP